MNDLVMACGLGGLIGIILFFVLALTGYIDKWTAALVKKTERLGSKFGSKQTPR
jgi:hypothetical protein